MSNQARFYCASGDGACLIIDQSLSDAGDITITMTMKGKQMFILVNADAADQIAAFISHSAKLARETANGT